MTSAAIDLAQVKFAWPGAPTLLDIDGFSVARGERVFLRGPSGSGKSTLLGLIGGVLAPDSGAVRVLDRPLHEMSAGGARPVPRRARGLRLPDVQPGPVPQGAGKRVARIALRAGTRGPDSRSRARRGSRAPARRAGSATARTCSRSRSRSFPSANSNASRLRARCSDDPSSSSRMNRPRRSITTRANRSSHCSCASAPRMARRCCS